MPVLQQAFCDMKADKARRTGDNDGVLQFHCEPNLLAGREF
jgi:hypothetical protein